MENDTKSPPDVEAASDHQPHGAGVPCLHCGAKRGVVLWMAMVKSQAAEAGGEMGEEKLAAVGCLQLIKAVAEITAGVLDDTLRAEMRADLTAAFAHQLDKFEERYKPIREYGQGMNAQAAAATHAGPERVQ